MFRALGCKVLGFRVSGLTAQGRAQRGLLNPSPRGTSCTALSSNKVYMRSLLGWLETRLAHMTLKYVNIA